MQTDQLHRYLDDPAQAHDWLKAWGLADVEAAHRNLVRMAESGLTLDLLAAICDQLAASLPRSSDADMALNNLERFVTGSRNPLSVGSLFERDADALPILVQIFSTSQHLGDLLIADPSGYDLLRLTEGQPVARDQLVEELAVEVAALGDDAAVMSLLRRFKRREMLRIAYGDIIRDQRLETVTSQISYLAEAIVETAVRYARKKQAEKRGEPLRPDGQPARFVVLGLGKLGGTELNYSSDIDLIFLYEADGETDAPRSVSNREFFDRMARDVVRLLTDATESGSAYRVDMRLRPEGKQGPLVHSIEQALQYYDVVGRTWERQAYVKARPVAGDLDLGHELLARLEPWIYRRYLNLADITGIKALKRRIEQGALRDGGDYLNVKTGKGGIRDIEFAIQFLQLLNAGDLPELRTGNTLEAIARLESVGCLTDQERSLLETNYRFLRQVEHRLQIMFDLQTHLLPESRDELRKLAIRLGYADGAERAALDAFEADYRTTTQLNRRILDHLLHEAFRDEAEAEPEVDLVLDPDPPEARIAEVLGRYPFRDVQAAYRSLSALATEKIRFLSTRRCRHFLASIAPGLLKAIAATPDPDSTLVNLENVSDSLGGKGVLWELFRFNPPSMNLYVELCATSPYLSGIVTGNPGMIDELMDSLVLNKLPSLETLRATLVDLARAAEDLDPILHSFKNTQHLRIGVRDILGKEDIEATIGALSDVAQVCLECVADAEFPHLVRKLGQPTIGEGPRSGEPCRFAILALGKMGGREMNYHSDLDLVFLYEADGPTIESRRARSDRTTTNQHFFSELGQRIIKVAGHLGPHGRLFEIDPRLRPTGKSGALAISLEGFERYFAEGQGQLWERQALTKARVVHVSEEFSPTVDATVAAAVFCRPWSGADAAAIREMRGRLEEASTRENLKRGVGGIVDIEFLVQMLVLEHGSRHPEIRVPGTLAALRALRAASLVDDDDFEYFSSSYRFLRTLESRLRLMNSTARDDLPSDPLELSKLARSLGHERSETLVENCRNYREQNRRRFNELFDEAERAT